MKFLIKNSIFLLVVFLCYVGCSSSSAVKEAASTSIEPNPGEGVIIFFSDLGDGSRQIMTIMIASNNYSILETIEGDKFVRNSQWSSLNDYSFNLLKHGVPRIDQFTSVAYKFPIENKEQDFYIMYYNNNSQIWQNVVTIPIKQGQQFILIDEKLNIRELNQNELGKYSNRKYTNNNYNKNFASISNQPGLIVSSTQMVLTP